jgi:sugar/nucleoside kinase (ribokinase family)
VYTKHKRFDYLCLDTREARLALHDKTSDQITLAKKVREKLSHKQSLGVTFGPDGSSLFDGYNHFQCPAFSDQIIDATGAGDAYFAITTCLLASGCKEELVPFIGNVFAGLKTKIIGNKSAVSKVALLKACAGILK